MEGNAAPPEMGTELKIPSEDLTKWPEGNQYNVESKAVHRKVSDVQPLTQRCQERKLKVKISLTSNIKTLYDNCILDAMKYLSCTVLEIGHKVVLALYSPSKLSSQLMPRGVKSLCKKVIQVMRAHDSRRRSSVTRG